MHYRGQVKAMWVVEERRRLLVGVSERDCQVRHFPQSKNSEPVLEGSRLEQYE
jgi:hypothetical protein